MNNFLKNDIVLVKYPFSDLTTFKVRPAIVINEKYPSNDIIIVPLTSRITIQLPGEFTLSKWKESGLHILSSVKRGIFTIDEKLVVQKIGVLQFEDIKKLRTSVKSWMGFADEKI